jgi:hypothetical protein
VFAIVRGAWWEKELKDWGIYLLNPRCFGVCVYLVDIKNNTTKNLWALRKFFKISAAPTPKMFAKKNLI